MIKKTFWILCFLTTTATATPTVNIHTTKGDIIIELNEARAPATVANFLHYVKEGFYTDTVFHRVIPNFMIQGGGFTPNMQEKVPYAPIANEAYNGLKNKRGTIAMARTQDPHSATSQFFINVKDNDGLNPGGADKYGYAVFGKVIKGMDVADAIVKVKTTTKPPHQHVPIEPIIIKSVELLPELSTQDPKS